jgi:oxygen-independent coproporphyrinogen-3 oxidase
MAYEIGKFGNRLPAYMEALLKEINHLGKICKDMYVENIYIGGGTPTALCDKNLEALLQTVKDNFDTESQPAKPFEYTIEAGRPDTVTQSNLALMKKYKVNRISINPQTLNESTLVKIGRGHSVQDFFNAYQTAKNHGFDFINIDLILGLEGETTQDVQNTLNGVSALNPNALTIHTLAIKRGSAIHNVPQAHSANVEKIEEMLNYAEEYIKQMELAPYYLYRQKNSPGNFENVGYSKPSFEGRYNIHMMEETRSVYAAGCGAVTKLVDNKNNKITRIVNYRGLDEYIRKVDELIERKYP